MFTQVTIGKLWSLGILKAKLSNEAIDQLNQSANQWIGKKIDWSSNLAGEISSGSQYKFEFPNWFDIRRLALDYINKEFDNKTFQISNLHCSDAWVVSQMAGDYNPVHSHGSWMSGIIYLKVPEQIKINSDKICLDGCLHFVYGNYHEPSLQNFGPRVIFPEIGDMYLFPGYLLHTVYPFKGSGERRSIAFNLDLI